LPLVAREHARRTLAADTLFHTIAEQTVIAGRVCQAAAACIRNKRKNIPQQCKVVSKPDASQSCVHETVAVGDQHDRSAARLKGATFNHSNSRSIIRAK
jgi:allophanate hydrolase subunit 2